MSANKDRFKKKAQATVKVLSMANILSPSKKNSTRKRSKHTRQRRRSKIIVVDYDSKQMTDITELVTDAPTEESEHQEFEDI